MVGENLMPHSVKDIVVIETDNIVMREFNGCRGKVIGVDRNDGSRIWYEVVVRNKAYLFSENEVKPYCKARSVRNREKKRRKGK